MSGIELAIEPGRVVTWEKFVEESSQRDVGSMALDGYVRGAPRFTRFTSQDGRSLGIKNFNHHEDVDREATLATCEQVDAAMKAGIVDSFKDRYGRFAAKVFVNDSDQDVCAAVWLLRNKDQVCHTGNIALARFVHVAGIMDRSAGSYPFDADMPFLETLNWINTPYNIARLNGDATSGDPEVHLNIIDSVGLRISQYMAGRSGSTPLDLNFKPLDKGKLWTMIREEGAQGKMGAISEGHKALILIRDQDPKQLHVSFWRQAEYVPIDFDALIRALQQDELQARIEAGLVPKETTELEANWGGGTTTFGSPRIIGTLLSMEHIAQRTDEFTLTS